MASLAREKEVLVVNPTKKKKKKGGGGKKKKKTGGKRKSGGGIVVVAARTGNPGKGKKKGGTRRRKSKRNPGIGLGGLALASAVGMASGILAQPGAKLLGAKLQEKGHPTLSKIARAGLPLVQGAALGAAGAALVSQRVGQAVIAGASAVSGLHAMSVLAEVTGKDGQQNQLLTKAGFTMLGADGYFERDGQVWRQLEDGQEVPLFSIANATPYRLKMSDGSFQTVGHLGDSDAGQLVLNDRGQIMQLPLGSLGAYQASQNLQGYQAAERLSGTSSVG